MDVKSVTVRGEYRMSTILNPLYSSPNLVILTRMLFSCACVWGKGRVWRDNGVGEWKMLF